MHDPAPQFGYTRAIDTKQRREIGGLPPSSLALKLRGELPLERRNRISSKCHVRQGVAGKDADRHQFHAGMHRRRPCDRTLNPKVTMIYELA